MSLLHDFRAVDVDQLPEYPVGRDVRFQGQYFLKFETARTCIRAWR